MLYHRKTKVYYYPEVKERKKGRKKKKKAASALVTTSQFNLLLDEQKGFAWIRIQHWTHIPSQRQAPEVSPSPSVFVVT